MAAQGARGSRLTDVGDVVCAVEAEAAVVSGLGNGTDQVLHANVAPATSRRQYGAHTLLDPVVHAAREQARVERRTILQTDRLAVTPWLPEDLDDLNRLHSDPVTMAFIGGRPETREESAARLHEYLDEQATRGWTKWRVEGAGGRLIGRAGFGVYAEDRELGFTIDRELWGQGLATEVATAGRWAQG